MPKAEARTRASKSLWRCPPSGLPPRVLIDAIRRRGQPDLEDHNLQRRIVTRLFVERPSADHADHRLRTGLEIFEISEDLDIPASQVLEFLRETIRHYEALLPERGRGTEQQDEAP